jgi:hypothetical protein
LPVRQKDLLCWAIGVGEITPVAQSQKKFLRRFFQKAASFSE